MNSMTVNGYKAKIEYLGKFNLRIPAKLHGDIAARASAEDKSINQFVSEILEQSVRE